MKKFVVSSILSLQILFNFSAFSQTHEVPRLRLNFAPGEMQATVEQALDKARGELQKILDVPDASRNFQNTIEAFEFTMGEIRELKYLFSLLQEVSTDERVRTEAATYSETLKKFETEIALRKDLFNVFEACRKNLELSTLNPAQKRLIEMMAWEYKKMGIALEGEALERLKELRVELSGLENQFKRNLGNNDAHIVVTPEELQGTSEQFRQKLEAKYTEGPMAGQYMYRLEDGRYRLTVKEHYGEFMKNATNEAVRRRFWFIDQNREAPQNVAILEKAIQIRHQIATLLGYESWAAYAIEGYMAGNAHTVRNFLEELKEDLAPKAAEERGALLEAWRKITPGAERVEPWNSGFVANQVIKEQFGLDTNLIKEYFPTDLVVDGVVGFFSEFIWLTTTKIKN